MRTTIEITEDHRAELLRIAGRRGEKGFSSVVREAIDIYLKHHASRTEAIQGALASRGALKGSEGEALSDDVRSIHASWR